MAGTCEAGDLQRPHDMTSTSSALQFQHEHPHQQPHHHQISTAYHVSRPSHSISAIVLSPPPPPLHHSTSIILDEDSFHVSRLMLQNENLNFQVNYSNHILIICIYICVCVSVCICICLSAKLQTSNHTFTFWPVHGSETIHDLPDHYVFLCSKLITIYRRACVRLFLKKSVFLKAWPCFYMHDILIMFLDTCVNIVYIYTRIKSALKWIGLSADQLLKNLL